MISGMLAATALTSDPSLFDDEPRDGGVATQPAKSPRGWMAIQFETYDNSTSPYRFMRQIIENFQGNTAPGVGTEVHAKRRVLTEFIVRIRSTDDYGKPHQRIGEWKIVDSLDATPRVANERNIPVGLREDIVKPLELAVAAAQRGDLQAAYDAVFEVLEKRFKLRDWAVANEILKAVGDDNYPVRVAVGALRYSSRAKSELRVWPLLLENVKKRLTANGADVQRILRGLL